MATYPIRQLADNGGTAQFVPVTAPEAVQFPDGSNLNTFIGSVATIESNPVAANHAVGEFLCINGQVYEVIDAITAGDSISLGENVQVVNLGSQITALNNGLTDIFPNHGTYETIGSANTTFTVDRTGLYLVYATSASSSTIMQLALYDNTTVRNVAVLFASNGAASAQLCYLEIGHTYRVLTRTNVGQAYLYS